MYKFLFHTAISFIIYSVYSTCLVAQDGGNRDFSGNANVELIKDINPGYSGSDLHNLINVNGILYFVAFNSGKGLWKSDGTTDGTRLVVDLDNPDIDPNYGEFTLFKEQLFFSGVETASGLGGELWATDGTPEGTRMIRDIYVGPGWSSPSYLTVKDSLLLFLASSEDLTAGGIETELWRSDGTFEGTYMVKDIWPGPYHSHGGPGIDGYTSSAVVNGIYYFAAKGPGEYVGENYIGGLELWRSDGTLEGTYIVTDLTPTYDAIYGEAWSYPNNLINFKNQLFFSAFSTNTGNELFKSDGTAGGTHLVKDICPDGGNCCGNSNHSYPGNFVIVDSLLYFMACDGIHGRELWKTDGTESGTNLVIDLTEGEESSTISEQTAFKGRLYFVYDDGDDNHGNELWCTDGTVEGTFLVKDIATGVDVFNRANNSNPRYLTVVNDLLYFSAYTVEYGDELWRTDGTTGGTIMVADMYTTAGWGSHPYELTNVNGTLYFAARSYNFDPDYIDTGYELWKLTYEPTGIKIKSSALNFKLHQNYPNPFNSSSIITFSIPRKEMVTLKIYDILGREVKILLNEEKAAGNYKVEFDASELSSGTYFYRLISGNYTDTKKFIVLK